MHAGREWTRPSPAARRRQPEPRREPRELHAPAPGRGRRTWAGRRSSRLRRRASTTTGIRGKLGRREPGARRPCARAGARTPAGEGRGRAARRERSASAFPEAADAASARPGARSRRRSGSEVRRGASLTDAYAEHLRAARHPDLDAGVGAARELCARELDARAAASARTPCRGAVRRRRPRGRRARPTTRPMRPRARGARPRPRPWPRARSCGKCRGSRALRQGS